MKLGHKVDMMGNGDSEIGYKFEMWVADLLTYHGKINVDYNLTFRVDNRHGSHVATCQIDVVFGEKYKVFCECKYYSGKNVPKDDVIKFAGVLEMLRVPFRYSAFFTNSEYSKGAVEFAGMKGMDLFNGDQLKSLDYGRFLRKFSAAYPNSIPIVAKPSLEQQLAAIDISRYRGRNNRMLSIDDYLRR